MKAKHTPGPWELEEWEFDYGPTGDFSIYQSRSKTPRMPIACVQLPFNGKRTEANARLIAAAPELLEALQAVLRSFPTDRDMRDAGWERAEIDLACRDYEAARAAISKALPNAAAKEAGK